MASGAGPAGRGAVHLVVVESPAKARTIRKYLGADYRVMATRGHVRDLPAKAGSVNPEDGFEMVYETGKRAARTLGAMANALGRVDTLVLATDPDREGEAIAWQVLSWLREKEAVGDRPVHRAAFHEVTPYAVRTALMRPRDIDMDLVRAWQARRALDYLVGYGLPPVLWRKVPGCRSAGRVQSVALRLICEREAEIEGFAPWAYWTVEAEAKDGAPFRAELRRLDGTGVDETGLATGGMAELAANRIRESAFTVSSVERDTLRRIPTPPFTTSTLQQEAARKLGFGIGETMEIAQRLYEGVDLGDETEGLITYMRTDSTAMAKIVKANVLDARLAPGAIPEGKVSAAEPGGVSRGRKDERACALRPAFENAPGRGAEGNGSRPRLAVGEDQPVAIDLRPAQPDDLVAAAPSEKQEPDDIRLLTAALAGLPVQHPMEPADLFAGQETCERLSPVPLHGPRWVRFEVTASDREIYDLAEKIERVIGVAGGGPAEPVEPLCYLRQGDAVERLRAEGRQQLAVEHGADALFRGRLVSVEMGVFPRTFDEVPEQRSDVSRRAACFRHRVRLARMAFPADLRDGLQRYRAKRDPSRPAASLHQQDIALPAGGPNANAEADDMAVPDRIFPLAGTKTGDGAVGEPHAFLAGHGSGFQDGADGLGGVHDHLVGKVGVFERGFRIAVTEQPGDGEDGLALPQGDAGMRVAEIVKANAAQPGFGADLVPKTLQPTLVPRPSAARCREHPLSASVQPVENAPGRLRQPDGAGSRLAVAEKEMPLAVGGPAERQDLALAATRQQEEPDHGDLPWRRVCMFRQCCGQAEYLVVGQEARPPLAAVAPDAPAGVGALRPKTHGFRFPHDDGEHRHGPVGGDRRRPKGSEPVPDIPPVDVVDPAARETGQDLVFQIAPVHLPRSRLPDPRVTLEHGLGDSLEEGPVGSRRDVLASPDRGERAGGGCARLAHAHGRGVADDLPDAFSTMLAMDKEAFAPRGQHTDAGASEFTVTDVVSGLARAERLDAGVRQDDLGHEHSPDCGFSRGSGSS